jgi:hypothetical protein
MALILRLLSLPAKSPAPNPAYTSTYTLIVAWGKHGWTSLDREVP